MIDLTKINFEKIKKQVLPLDKEKVQPIEEILIR